MASSSLFDMRSWWLLAQEIEDVRAAFGKFGNSLSRGGKDVRCRGIGVVGDHLSCGAATIWKVPQFHTPTDEK